MKKQNLFRQAQQEAQAVILEVIAELKEEMVGEKEGTHHQRVRIRLEKRLGKGQVLSPPKGQ